MIKQRLPLVAASLAVLLVGACAAHGTPTTATTGATMEARIANEEAVQQLANARCNRDERCGFIGPGKTHPDRGTCERTVNKETSSDFRSADCKGIKPALLNECANDVTKLACSLDKPLVMMLTSCMGDELCK